MAEKTRYTARCHCYHGDDGCGYRVNLGCVEGLDPLALEISIIDGRAL